MKNLHATVEKFSQQLQAKLSQNNFSKSKGDDKQLLEPKASIQLRTENLNLDTNAGASSLGCRAHDSRRRASNPHPRAGSLCRLIRKSPPVYFAGAMSAPHQRSGQGRLGLVWGSQRTTP